MVLVGRHRVVRPPRGKDCDATLSVGATRLRADGEAGSARDRHVNLVEDRIGRDRVGRPVRVGRRVWQASWYAWSDLIPSSPPASMIPSCCGVAPPDRPRKYELSPSLYQTSSEPSSLATVAITLTAVSPALYRSSMMMVEGTVWLGSLQPSRIWWSGPIAMPCGPAQPLIGTLRTLSIFSVPFDCTLKTITASGWVPLCYIGSDRITQTLQQAVRMNFILDLELRMTNLRFRQVALPLALD